MPQAKPKPKKSLGQNFLIDRGVVRDLIEAAELSRDDTVLEVGAGTGAVTAELARRAGRVIAVEFDRDLIPLLEENLGKVGDVEIINADILSLDPQPLLRSPRFKVVGSIPYQITSPLIHQILRAKVLPESITLIVQKEVAEKIAARPPKATYLANFVSRFGEARVVRTIKPGAFRPAPKVDSAILKIEIDEKPPTPDHRFEKFLHHGFASPRRMIRHRFPEEVLKTAQVDPRARPAHLTKEDWRRLYRELGQSQDRSKGRRGGGVWIKTGA